MGGVKSANNGTPVPAESMERSAETKRNPRSQSMHRTRGRVRMSQAAERIRQAATCVGIASLVKAHLALDKAPGPLTENAPFLPHPDRQVQYWT